MKEGGKFKKAKRSVKDITFEGFILHGYDASLADG
jgi:hypothetical protein